MPSWVDATIENVKLWALTSYLGIVLVEMVVFLGIRDGKGVNVTLLSYVGKIFRYTGNQ
jgi:hypothetical protein